MLCFYTHVSNLLHLHYKISSLLKKHKSDKNWKIDAGIKATMIFEMSPYFHYDKNFTDIKSKDILVGNFTVDGVKIPIKRIMEQSRACNAYLISDKRTLKLLSSDDLNI
jgi:hypothetical protein